VSTEILQPFQLAPSGGVAVTAVPSQQVQQHLQSLVSTNPGDRLMQPQYGVPLAGYLFGLDRSQVALLANTDISVAIGKWEPMVSIRDVRTTLSNDSLGMLAITVEYSPGPAPSSSGAQVHTATILVGGDVIES
jgi:uncharacterized protein